MAPNHHHHGHYDTQEYAGDRAERTHRTMRHMPDEDRSTRVDIQDSITGSQASELAPEVRMGDDRALGDTPNWDAFDSEQLYDFATQQNDPTTADALGRTFNEGGNGLAEAANGLLDAVTQLDGAWSGVAADSARGALAPLAKAAGQAGQTAQMMGVQMSRQSVAAAEVRKLPPAQKFDHKQSAAAMLAGGPAAMQADLKAQKDAADAVKREQIAHLTAYTQAMGAVDAQTPSFVPPKAQIHPGAGGDAKITGGAVPFSGRPGGFDQGTSTGAPSGGYTGVNPGAGGGYGDNPDGSDGGTDFTLPGSLPGTSTAGFTSGGPTAPVSAPTAPVGGAHLAGPSAGAGGFGGTFGNFGGGASGAGGTGGAGGAGAGEGARAGGGAGARGPVPAGMGGQGAAGRGAGGTGGAGGRRKGEDDDEHDRPAFLVEGDPEGTFGSDQLTAPSVIGSDEDD
jgi:hypothetical protein